jgi:hypothetical protein
MRSFDTIRVTDVVKRACDEGASEGVMFRVTPPKSRGEGISDARKMTHTCYKATKSQGLTSTQNTSSVAGFEVWYNNEAVEFYYYVPNTHVENHYRRHLSGFYEGVDITQLVRPDERWPRTEQGQHVAVTRLGLTHHYFEPIGTAATSEEDRVDDPYQALLNEIDSKEQTSVVMQVLYKPALDSWRTGSLGGLSLAEYADKIEETQAVNHGWYGVGSSTLETESDAAEAANAVRTRMSGHAFHVEVRLAVINDDPKKAADDLEDLVVVFQNQFVGQTKQSFTPLSTDPHHVLAQMVARKPISLDPATGLGKLRALTSSSCPYIILGVDELAELAHLPGGGQIAVDGIVWSHSPVVGTLPPDAEKFTPVTDEERAAWDAKHGQSTGEGR